MASSLRSARMLRRLQRPSALLNPATLTPHHPTNLRTLKSKDIINPHSIPHETDDLALKSIPLPDTSSSPLESMSADEAYAEYAKHFAGTALAERVKNRDEYNYTMFPANWGQDHRSICTAQRLVHFSGLAPGHPMFDVDGAFVFQRLMGYLRAQYPRYGIREVVTPSVFKRDLWHKSGHAEVFADDMFGVSPGTDDLKEEAFRGLGLKPMNCPAHCEMFYMNQKGMGYKDLPIRMAEFSGLFRNEVYSALSGLTRCREFHQDDAHIFCRPDQVQSEILSTLRFVRETYTTFRLPEPTFKIATRPERFLGNSERWDEAEAALINALKELQVSFTIAEGDGAFYGPKIDINLEDRRGKQNQLATIQLDFQLPERFDLKYRDNTGAFRRPVIIHRAVMGSIERFLALVMENCEGKWPFWLSPRQLMIIPLHEKDPALARYSQEVLASLTGKRDEDKRVPMQGNRYFNVQADFRKKTLSQKVAAALESFNFVAVIGHNEVKSRTVMLEGRKFPPRAVNVNDLRDLFIRLEDMYI